MSKATEELTAFMREKGEDISRKDLDTITDFFMAMEPEEAAEVRPWVYEGLWLTVAAPEYDGDIRPEDLD
jgi:hypothetical protein